MKRVKEVDFMKKRYLYWGSASVLAILLLFSSYKVMNSRTFQFFGGLTSQVDTEEKVVALTFDDGPTKKVDSVLPILEKYNAKATFFLSGNDIEKNPQEAEKNRKGWPSNRKSYIFTSTDGVEISFFHQRGS